MENIWPLSAAAFHIDAASSPIWALPLRTFIQEILRRGRTSYSTLHVTLYYMIRFYVLSHKLTKKQTRSPSRMRAMHCGRRMFLTALILASKYLQDYSYSARIWSKILGFNTSEINHHKLMFLEVVGWRLYISEASFRRWTNLILKLTLTAGNLLAADLKLKGLGVPESPLSI